MLDYPNQVMGMRAMIGFLITVITGMTREKAGSAPKGLTRDTMSHTPSLKTSVTGRQCF
jgi:hypothetical protein